MTIVLRGLTVYAVLFVLFRVMGKRSLNKATTFDFVLLLIISETTQQALVGEDFSLAACFLLVTTLLGADLILSYVKRISPTVEKTMDDAPLVIVDHGVPLKDRMRWARVDEDDVLDAARETRGLTKISEIRYAVLEQDGKISVIPYQWQ